MFRTFRKERMEEKECDGTVLSIPPQEIEQLKQPAVRERFAKDFKVFLLSSST